MFSVGDRSIEKERLQNVVAEWCKGNEGITHIDLAQGEGFLFIKCKDKESAGKGTFFTFLQNMARHFLPVIYNLI